MNLRNFNQRLIPAGEQSGLQTRIATTRSVSSWVGRKAKAERLPQNELLNEKAHMKTSPYLLVFATCALISCAGEPTTVTTTTTTREVIMTSPATREVLVTQAPPAVRVRRSPPRQARDIFGQPVIGVGPARSTCNLHADRASKAGVCSGGRPLDPSSRWLGVDRRPLAVK